MFQLTRRLAAFILTLSNISVFSAGLVSFEVNLAPNKPTLLTNNLSPPQKINVMCEVFVAASTKHYLSIQIYNGKGVFNGTTFKKGDSMVSGLNHLQLIPLSADPNTQAQVTNLGPNPMRIVCS